MLRRKLGGVGEEVADFVEVDLEGPWHLFGRGAGEQFAGERTGIGAEVVRNRAVRVLEGFFDNRDIAGLLTDGKLHAGAHLEGADVHFLAIDEDVAVCNELLGSENRRCKL